MFKRIIILTALVLITFQGTAIADSESTVKATAFTIALNGIGLLGNTRQIIKGERYIPVAVYGILTGYVTISAVIFYSQWHDEWRNEGLIPVGIGAAAIVLSIANLMQDPPKKESSETNASERAMRLHPTLHIERGALTGGGIQMVVSF